MFCLASSLNLRPTTSLMKAAELFFDIVKLFEVMKRDQNWMFCSFSKHKLLKFSTENRKKGRTLFVKHLLMKSWMLWDRRPQSKKERKNFGVKNKFCTYFWNVSITLFLHTILKFLPVSLKMWTLFSCLYSVWSIALIWDQPQIDGDSRTVFWPFQIISSHVKLFEIECAWV